MQIDTEAGTTEKDGVLHPAQAYESTEQIVARTAHDINNLVCPILAYSELSMQRIGPNDPLFTYMTKIREAALRTAVLAQQLMKLGHHPHG